MKISKFFSRRLTLQLTTAVFLILVGVGLLIAAFVIKPPGEIHSSVLVAFGEILTFSGSLFGIDYHYKYRSSDK